jgi:hypothetical protein
MVLLQAGTSDARQIPDSVVRLFKNCDRLLRFLSLGGLRSTCGATLIPTRGSNRELPSIPDMPFSNFPVITALQCANLIIILSSVGRCLDDGLRARAWPSPMDDRRRGLLGHGWCEL